VVVLSPELAWIQRFQSGQWDAELLPVGAEGTASWGRAGGTAGQGGREGAGLCGQCQQRQRL